MRRRGAWRSIPGGMDGRADSRRRLARAAAHGALAAGAALLTACASLPAPVSDRRGDGAEWRGRTSAARAWLAGHHAEPWARQVRYQGPPIILRFSAHNPADASVVREVFLPAFEVLRRMSDGRIVVQPTWGGGGHSLSAGWEALAQGRTDMTACYASLEAETRGFQLLTLLDLPGLFPNAAVATRVSEELYAKYFRADFARNGVLLARMKATGPAVLFSRAPVRGTADLAGLAVGTPDGVQKETLRALGARPEVTESPRVRAALEAGALDGAAITEAAAAVYGVDRVMRYELAADLGRTNLEYCLSPSFYRALPADLRPVLNAWLRAEAQAEAQIFYGVAGAAARETFRASGGQITTLDAVEQARWDTRLADVEAAAVARLERAGQPARRFMAEVRALTARYGAMSENELMRDAIEHPITGMIE